MTKCPKECPCHSNPEGTRYYASVIDAGKHGLLAGPFRLHATALNWVDRARKVANAVDLKSAFYAFGTCAVKKGPFKPGILNERLGL